MSFLRVTTQAHRSGECDGNASSPNWDIDRVGNALTTEHYLFVILALVDALLSLLRVAWPGSPL